MLPRSTFSIRPQWFLKFQVKLQLQKKKHTIDGQNLGLLTWIFSSQHWSSAVIEEHICWKWSFNTMWSPDRIFFLLLLFGLFLRLSGSGRVCFGLILITTTSSCCDLTFTCWCLGIEESWSIAYIISIKMNFHFKK